MLSQNFNKIFEIFSINQFNYQHETKITTIKPIIITKITQITSSIIAAAAAAATTTRRKTIRTTKCFIMFFLVYILILQKPIVQVWGGSCREAQLCCSGRDSSCVVQKTPINVIIEDLNDKPCYCDHACLKLGDCCKDFKDHCGVLDCQISDWGQWSDCDVACGMGITVRTRYIIQAPQNGGKHCSTLMQKRGCQGFRCHGQRERKILKETALLLPAALSSSKRHLNGSQDDIERHRDTYAHNRELEYCVEFEVLKSSKACHKLPSYNLMIEGDRITVHCDLEAFVYENDNYNSKSDNSKRYSNKQSNSAINSNKIQMQGNSQLNLNELSSNYSLRSKKNNKTDYYTNNNDNNKWIENNYNNNGNEDNDDDDEDSSNNNNNNNNNNDDDGNGNEYEEEKTENVNDEHHNNNYNYNDNDNGNDDDDEDNDNDNNYHRYDIKRMKYHKNKKYAVAKRATIATTTTYSIMKSATTTTTMATRTSTSALKTKLMQMSTLLQYHCRGEGLSGRTTRWSALAAPSCHGKWLRLTVGIPKPCQNEQFTFV